MPGVVLIETQEDSGWMYKALRVFSFDVDHSVSWGDTGPAGPCKTVQYGYETENVHAFHLCTELCQFFVHASTSPQLILQIFRHAAQLILMHLFQQVQLREREIEKTERVSLLSRNF